MLEELKEKFNELSALKKLTIWVSSGIYILMWLIAPIFIPVVVTLFFIIMGIVYVWAEDM